MLVPATVSTSYGQDTIRYENLEFSWCQNGWTLYKASKRSKKGFYNYSGGCDDGSYCFRNGTFKENRRQIVFGPANNFCFQRYFDAKSRDSIIGIPTDTNFIKETVFLKRGDTLVCTEKEYQRKVYWYVRKAGR